MSHPSWPWFTSAYPCPVCGGSPRRRDDRGEGVLYESEERCDRCGLWESDFSYGHYSERIGFVAFEWSYSGTDENNTRYADRKAAREEMKRAFAHPEFAGMIEHTPKVILAGWFEDHDCPLQSAAAMGLAEMEATS